MRKLSIPWPFPEPLQARNVRRIESHASAGGLEHHTNPGQFGLSANPLANDQFPQPTVAKSIRQPGFNFISRLIIGMNQPLRAALLPVVILFSSQYFFVDRSD
ncbi:MAG: hypothetical protein IT448_10325 [Phycisphaerales bacterium]|nr:hypothetical protein [Phycisphaerales bacterium]